MADRYFDLCVLFWFDIDFNLNLYQITSTHMYWHEHAYEYLNKV
jgi:hypothetical protein